MDETGWRLRGSQRAMWGAFTERHAILQITASRHDDHAKKLLGNSRAIITSDRWSRVPQSVDTEMREIASVGR